MWPVYYDTQRIANNIIGNRSTIHEVLRVQIIEATKKIIQFLQQTDLYKLRNKNRN